MRLRDIRESDVLTAILMNDLDDACRYLQGIAGITDGGVAAMIFSGFDWVHAGRDEREVMVRNWIRIEAAYADQPDPWPDYTAMTTFADEVKKELEELAKLDVPGANKALKALERGDIVEIANVADDPMSVREMADLIIDMCG